ncbi:hypothetical protein BU26DRAFT_68499 [Trematosphaeria pertusa]|uniref:Uncharacterized protein n=1 Tax=Trematosphaeria pertusa TaxID=390896 RepID=A0A6A6I537_9PLEO|nr:uncharacterized protein BU26DRAFT_68499 [Trematosphaeria pertusa]KAF2245436.1 hypothetical protein BU26DRAFT_68499 [Trematosphaeria pertusa]
MIRHLFHPRNAQAALDRLLNADVDASVFVTMCMADEPPAVEEKSVAEIMNDPLRLLVRNPNKGIYLKLEAARYYKKHMLDIVAGREQKRLQQCGGISDIEIERLLQPWKLNYMLNQAICLDPAFKLMLSPLPATVLSEQLGRTILEVDLGDEPFSDHLPYSLGLLPASQWMNNMVRIAIRLACAQKGLLQHTYGLTVADLRSLTDEVLGAAVLRATGLGWAILQWFKTPIPKYILATILGKEVEELKERSGSGKRGREDLHSSDGERRDEAKKARVENAHADEDILVGAKVSIHLRKICQGVCNRSAWACRVFIY